MELAAEETIYACLYSDGHVHLKDVGKECIKEQWIPIAIYRMADGQPTVILFKSQELVRKFGKRNLPSNWTHGAVQLSQKNLDWLITKNLNLEVFDFPKKLKDNPDIELGFEVMEFQDEPDLHYRRNYEVKKL